MINVFNRYQMIARKQSLRFNNICKLKINLVGLGHFCREVNHYNFNNKTNYVPLSSKSFFFFRVGPIWFYTPSHIVYRNISVDQIQITLLDLFSLFARHSGTLLFHRLSFCHRTETVPSLFSTSTLLWSAEQKPR